MIRFSILHMINTLLRGNDSADWLSQILGLQELIESKVSLGKRLVVQTWAPAKDGGRRHRNFILPWAPAIVKPWRKIEPAPFRRVTKTGLVQAGANCRTAHGLGHSLALGLADEIIDLRREGRLCGHLRRRACHVHLGRLGELEALPALDSAQESGNPADASANVRYPKRLGSLSAFAPPLIP